VLSRTKPVSVVVTSEAEVLNSRDFAPRQITTTQANLVSVASEVNDRVPTIAEKSHIEGVPSGPAGNAHLRCRARGERAIRDVQLDARAIWTKGFSRPGK